MSVWTTRLRCCADKSGKAAQSAIHASAGAARTSSVPLFNAAGRRAGDSVQPTVRFTDRPALTLSTSKRDRTAAAATDRSSADNHRRPPPQ